MFNLLALKALPWRLIGLSALAFAVLALFAHDRITLAQNGKLKAQLERSESARRADRSAYESAQRIASAENKRLVAEENKLRAQISDSSRTSYLADRERLRLQARTAQGAPRVSGASGVPQAAGGADGEELRLSGPQLLRAQELELQLNALIDWVAGQSKVDPNK